MSEISHIVEVNADRPQVEIVRWAADRVQRGGVIGYPTETAYGLGADVLHRGARERIFAIKGRDRDKALPVIVSDLDQLAFLCRPIPARVGALAKRFWPGPLTLVIPVRRELQDDLDGASVAVRVSGLALARELARVSGCCLTATSANRSGGVPARSARDVWTTFGSELDLILDGGDVAGLRPSTIVDLMGEEPRLLREGPVVFDAVLQALRDGRDGPAP